MFVRTLSLQSPPTLPPLSPTKSPRPNDAIGTVAPFPRPPARMIHFTNRKPPGTRFYFYYRYSRNSKRHRLDRFAFYFRFELSGLCFERKFCVFFSVERRPPVRLAAVDQPDFRFRTLKTI